MECSDATGDHKNSQVILNDKLMTDALLGTIPIKSEHSYSLTSDGDSMPDSPSEGKFEICDEIREHVKLSTLVIFFLLIFVQLFGASWRQSLL